MNSLDKIFLEKIRVCRMDISILAYLSHINEITLQEGETMATSTFERKIIISSPEGLQRLEKVMADQTPKKPISENHFSSEDRKRGEALLKQCQLCSPR